MMYFILGSFPLRPYNICLLKLQNLCFESGKFLSYRGVYQGTQLPGRGRILLRKGPSGRFGHKLFIITALSKRSQVLYSCPSRLRIRQEVVCPCPGRPGYPEHGISVRPGLCYLLIRFSERGSVSWKVPGPANSCSRPFPWTPSPPPQLLKHPYLPGLYSTKMGVSDFAALKPDILKGKSNTEYLLVAHLLPEKD